MPRRSRNYRAFVRIDSSGEVVPGSLVKRPKQPSGGGRWYEIPANVCCPITTTTSTSSSTTTTTTT